MTASLSILLFVTVVFGLVFALRLARIGALVAFLLAGIIAGPYVLNLFQLTDNWAILGNLGIMFLWFMLGLGINMRRLWGLRRAIFGFGAAQVLMVVAILFPLLFGVTGWSIMGCVMVALMLSMSSTSEDVQLLSDRNQVNTEMGRQTFSILLFQDLLAIPLLAMMPVLSGKSFNFGATAIDVLVWSVVLILGVVIIGRFVLNPLMRQVARLKSKEAFLLAILLNIALWASIAEWIGMPVGLGAFLAGMLLSETIYNHQVTAEISPYAMLFLAFFFISLGMGLNLSVLGQYWYIVVAGVIGLIAAKFVAIFMVARVRHVSLPDAIMIALVLSQAGEFGLLMLQTMRSSGIDAIPVQHQEILTAIIMLSIMATPIILAVFDRLQRTGKLFSPNLMPSRPRVSDAPKVVICGFGRVGQLVAQMLQAQKISYVALDMDVNIVMLGREHGYNVVYGNSTNADVLTDIGLNPRKTRAVVVALDNASTARDTVITVREIAPRIRVFARARNLTESKLLVKEGAQIALPETIESSLFLGYGVLEHLGVSQNALTRILNELRQDNYARVEDPVSDN
mgnify:FL=1